MKGPTVLIAGVGLGVIGTLALTHTSPAAILGMDEPSSEPPKVIGGARSPGASVEPMDLSFGDWQAWFVHSDNGYRQVVYNMPGQPGVFVGELYDDQGRPVGQELTRARERGVTHIEDISRLSTWLSHDFVYPPSVPEVQGRELNAGQIASQADPIYLMVDPFDGPARQQQAQITALMEDLDARVIPVPNAGPDAYDGLHAILEAGRMADSDETSLDLFFRALSGESVIPHAQPGDPVHESTFMAFSKNVSLQSRLGIQELPAVIHASDDKGIAVVTLRQWMADQAE